MFKLFLKVNWFMMNLIFRSIYNSVHTIKIVQNCFKILQFFTKNVNLTVKATTVQMLNPIISTVANRDV